MPLRSLPEVRPLGVVYSPRMNDRSSAAARATNGSAVRDVTASSPAVRDADAILARIADDETAALEARERYRDQQMAPLEPDPRISGFLVPGEEIIAVRRSVLLDRREPSPGARCPQHPGLSGDLYVTSTRLLHIGRTVIEYDLAAIREADVSAEHLLLVLSDGAGMILDVDRPRLLRVEIAAARAWQPPDHGDTRVAGPTSDAR
jgi:hypothetical protein